MNKMISGCQGSGWREMNQQSTENFLGQRIYFESYYTGGYMSFIIFLSILAECTTPRVNSKVNYGLWVLMMCQCRLILDKKCSTLVSDVDNGGGGADMGAEGTWEISMHLLFIFVANLKLL